MSTTTISSPEQSQGDLLSAAHDAAILHRCFAHLALTRDSNVHVLGSRYAR